MLSPSQHHGAKGEEDGNQRESILEGGAQQEPKPKRPEQGWHHRTNRAVQSTEAARHGSETIGQDALRLVRFCLVHVVFRELWLGR